MSKELTVDCPNCGNTIAWNEQQTYRPFCSKRCQDNDFVDWAHEEKRIAGSNVYDDVFSASDLLGDVDSH